MTQQESREYFSLAPASHQSGRLGEAEALYRQVLASYDPVSVRRPVGLRGFITSSN